MTQLLTNKTLLKLRADNDINVRALRKLNSNSLVKNIDINENQFESIKV